MSAQASEAKSQETLRTGQDPSLAERPTRLAQHWAGRTWSASWHGAAASMLVALSLLATAAPLAAQDEPVDPDLPPPAEPAAPAPIPAAPPAQAVRDRLAEAMAPTPGGLDARKVAAQAVATSPALAAKEAELRAAAAKVDQALVAYFPRASVSFSYTRLSETESTLDSGVPNAPPMELDTFQNSYSLVTKLAVPISDYLLRLTQAYAAASRAKDAKRLEKRAEQLQIQASAKVAFLNWVRAKGHHAVARLSVPQAQAHVKDARVTLEVGLIARADLLRLEAQLAQAKHLATAAAGFERVADYYLRTLMHQGGGAPLALGIDVMADPGPADGRDLTALKQTAHSRRLELKAMSASRSALEKARSVTKAGYYPRLDGFANMTYANPNQRIFPSEDKFQATWELGLQVSWTVNDTFTTLGSDAEARANIMVLDKQMQVLRDGISSAVTSAYQDGHTARSAIGAAQVRENAAIEVLRARRQLLLAGKATSTDIVDAESELTRARLQRVDAHVDVLIAQVKLDHALGGANSPQSAPLRPLR